MNHDEIHTADDGLIADAFPWPPAEDESIPGAFARTWRGAALEPRRFFAAMPAAGGLGAALLYYLPLGILVSAIEAAWSGPMANLQPERDVVLGAGDMMAMSPLVQFLLSPLILLLTLFLAAAVTHLMLKLFGGATHGLPFTTRVFAFAYSPQVFGIVPVVGTAVGFVWMVVIAIVGLREGHGTSTGRAAAAVLIPVFLAATVLAIAAFIAVTGRLMME